MKHYMKHYQPHVAGALLGLGVSAAALFLAVDAARAELGLAVAPFGRPSVVVVHVLATLPLSLLLAAWLADRLPKMPWTAAACLAVAVAVAAWTGGAGGDLAAQLDRGREGFTARLLVRCLWCLVLQAPWCILSNMLATQQKPRGQPQGAVLPLALVSATVLPGVYADHLLQSEAAQAAEWVGRGRLVRAQAAVTALCDLGSTRLVGEKTPAALRLELDWAVASFQATARRPLPLSATLKERLEHGRVLAMLGRFDEAEQLVAGLGETDLEAVSLRAAILQELNRYVESSRCYRAALVLLKDRDGPGVVAARVRAYDGLAFNAREQQADSEVRALYADGLEQVPEARAHFHYQLGRYHHDRGRPAEALTHLEAAERLDAVAYGPRSRSLIADLRQQTPGCLLPRR